METTPLNSAAIAEEPNKLGYNPSDYPLIQDMIHHLLSGKQKRGIDTDWLCKNGKIVKDSLNEYPE